MQILRERYTLCHHYMVLITDYTLGKIEKSKIFSKIDANSAFWQRKLSDESKLLTTFITPWGRYCFERLPYGISTGSEQFQKVMEEKLEGLEGIECQIDNMLVHDETQQIHDEKFASSSEMIS